MIKQYINNRSCAILGLGVSNLPLAEYLCEQGIPLTVYDKADVSELGEAAAKLSRKGVRFVKADGEFCGVAEDVVFRSPGIRPDRAGIVAARERGAEIISEMELFLRLTKATSFGITGSDGKTTTTTLTGKFLEAQSAISENKRIYVGGNIGKPLLTEAEGMSQRDAAVLELSSFQLMTVCDAPQCVAITNISENHLDWHTDMNEYISAKKNIIGADTRRLVTNADSAQTTEIALWAAQRGNIEIFLFSSLKSAHEIHTLLPSAVAVCSDGEYITVGDERVLRLADIKLPGRHNIENFMTAVGLTYGYVDKSVYTSVASDFYGVEHRLEMVRMLDGVEYYNSSIDSSPTRSVAALSAMCGRSLVLICGGYDKKLDYAPLASAICTHKGVHTLILTGATGKKIGSELEKYISENGIGAEIRVEYHADFEDAVRTASKYAKQGDAVLLSPASASFDAFKNFAERGKVFKRIVNSF